MLVFQQKYRFLKLNAVMLHSRQWLLPSHSFLRLSCVVSTNCQNFLQAAMDLFEVAIKRDVRPATTISRCVLVAGTSLFLCSHPESQLTNVSEESPLHSTPCTHHCREYSEFMKRHRPLDTAGKALQLLLCELYFIFYKILL